MKLPKIRLKNVIEERPLYDIGFSLSITCRKLRSKTDIFVFSAIFVVTGGRDIGRVTDNVRSAVRKK